VRKALPELGVAFQLVAQRGEGERFEQVLHDTHG
jgi:hypothetical protein